MGSLGLLDLEQQLRFENVDRLGGLAFIEIEVRVLFDA